MGPPVSLANLKPVTEGSLRASHSYFMLCSIFICAPPPFFYIGGGRRLVKRLAEDRGEGGGCFCEREIDRERERMNIPERHYLKQNKRFAPFTKS